MAAVQTAVVLVAVDGVFEGTHGGGGESRPLQLQILDTTETEELRTHRDISTVSVWTPRGSSRANSSRIIFTSEGERVKAPTRLFLLQLESMKEAPSSLLISCSFIPATFR